MKITVKHILNYGQHYFYAVDETAKTLLSFCSNNRKAFTKAQIDLAKKLGIEVEILPMDIN